MYSKNKLFEPSDFIDDSSVGSILIDVTIDLNLFHSFKLIDIFSSLEILFDDGLELRKISRNQ